jgi:two-component system, sensor histidine kinase PdtaS
LFKNILAYCFFLVLFFNSSTLVLASNKPLPITGKNVITLNNYLSNYKRYKFTDTQKATSFLQQFYFEAKKSNSTSGLAYYYLSASEEATSVGNLTTGVQYGKLAQNLFFQLKDSFNYMESTYFLAAAYLYQGNGKALEQSIDQVFERIPSNYSYEQNGMLFSLLANYYSVIDLSKAFNYILKMKVNYQKANFELGLIDAYNELSNYYNIVFEFKKSFYYGNKALQIAYKTNAENHFALANIYLNLAEIKNNLTSYKEALKLAEKGLSHALKCKNSGYINRAYIVKSTICFKMKQFAKSKTAANIALKNSQGDPRVLFQSNFCLALLAQEENDLPELERFVNQCIYYQKSVLVDLRTKASLQEILTYLYFKQGKLLLAYTALKQQNKYEQAFLNQKSDNYLKSLQVKYEFKEVSNQLKFSLTKERLKNEKIKTQRINNVLLSIIIATLAVFLFILFLAYRKSLIQKRNLELARNELEQSLADKTILMKEIHHRVKNNFQLITSFLNPKLLAESDNIQEFSKRTTARIETMAKVHNQLYENDTVEAIDFYSYCQQLSTDVLHSFETKNKAINLTIVPTDIQFNLQTILPLGLLLNELLMNTLKHAFNKQKTGEIFIQLSQSGSNYTLIFQDSGSGFHTDKKASFGLQLIDALASQLAAELEVKTENGTTYKLDFKQLK